MKRVFSGVRPTGRLHLGNYLGAVKNYVALQDDYECIYCVVDLHALTTLEETATLKENIYEMMLDLLASGLDPKKCILFVQSQVPEINELFTLFGMITPLSWLLRVPTFKEKVKMHPDNVNYGLVGYPVLQAADISLYKADVVPVGVDQLPHLELTREIVRRFNEKFGQTFPEPQARLTNFPTVVGLDGKDKMSKSLNNHIELALSEEETAKKVMSAVTDPARQYKTDPGHPDICNVYKLHNYFSPQAVAQITDDCQNARIGCVQCKRALAEAINAYLRPIRAKRSELAKNPDEIYRIMADGAERAGVIARQTLDEVREKMNLR
ncbi:MULTISPECIES: tryptophan--tRNA ligase [Dehalococcoides]|jgi:tryptophanyl-tRNA synthetase|uniref:Tryptophan--tRNA ligase n=2 Tax=Dehalococcoides mccartyi TaxID=61435 RepID=A0A1S7AYP7_9CHLR|nr:MULTISPECIES: tryptophan--tRNA ligase [Dehalococcoides]AGG06801.1 tryptophan--tRNA ligase [Dehalococcoides mccartyi DCMB5]AGG08296.1 tryptophan--tRNA ligase [Dehalococcoides mccartyi BTF08]AQU06330.1 tryptophan--tRNA ligase [Dehalococcoides mccartyi]AQU07772.1 tryptophan--tRNA ligase [Dehalococcoides mccartyi]AQW62801.1 tryptophan--tRNA ligase [Dehalococcoides mccartyi]